jgi:hypothetical protein
VVVNGGLCVCDRKGGVRHCDGSEVVINFCAVVLVMTCVCMFECYAYRQLSVIAWVEVRVRVV